MRAKARGLFFVGACGVGIAAWGADGPAMSVFVTAAQVEERKDVDEATKNALKAKRDQAREVRKALEKQFKEQLGKKRETWPPEKDEELYRLEEAEALADADYEYRKIDLKANADAVKDLVRATQGKGLQAGRKDAIITASNFEEAELVVQVLARRASKTLPTQMKADNCFVLFSIGPGGKTDPARFVKVPANYRAKKFGLYAWKIASPTQEKPVFIYESYNGGGNEFGCHGAAANAGSGLINKFIEDNYSTITGR